MKKIVITLLLFISFIGYSQTNGITYQAVIFNPSGEQLPGVNNSNAPLANKNICLKFSIIDYNSQYEYIETIQTNTDEFGMVNLIIGSGDQIGGYASSFSNVLWNANPKNLKVDLSTTGVCSYYTEISNQPFTAVPFALFALNTESTAALTALQATVAANATSATNAIAAVQADVDQNETDSDAADVVLQNNINTLQTTVTSNATATTTALGLKEDAINKSTTTTLGASDVLFPTQKAVKTYVDTNITTVNASNAALQATVAANATSATNAIAAVQADVNQNETDSDAADVVLQDNINTLQTTVTSNATATTTALGLKEDAINKSTTTTLGTSDVLFPTQKAVKTYVDTNITTVNTSNAALQATVAANATAANTAIAAVQADVNQNETDSDAADVVLQNNINTLQTTVTSNATATTTALGLKENAINKSTDVTLADATNTKFPTELAVKTYVNEQITNNGSNYLPLTGGTLTGQLFTPSVVFNNSSTWELGNSGTSFSLYQAGCCSRLIMDNDGNLGIGGNYTPQYKLDVEGNGRFTNSVLANSFIIQNGLSSQFLKADGSVDSNAYFLSNTSNIAIGYVAGSGGQGLHSIAIGSNVAQGEQAEGGVGIGYAAAQYDQGENAVALGLFAGQYSQAANSVAIGANTEANATNSVALGTGAIVNAANTIQLGNTNVTDVNTSGAYTGSGFKTPTGTSSQYLMADGSVSSGSSSSGVPYTGATAAVDLGDYNLTVNGLTIGSNGTSMDGVSYSSTVIGNQATIGSGYSAASESSAFGYKASATGPQSIAIGSEASANQTQGISIGYHASVGTGYGFAIGSYSQSNGMYSAALGPFSQTSGDYSVALGYQANATAENSIAIGKDANVTTANTIQLGNTNVTDVNTSGSITAKSIISSGRMVMSTATIDYSELNNYDVSNVSILFVKPNSSWTNIYGLTGGVVGQIIHIYTVNNQTPNCCTGLSLWDYDSGGNDGIQKFVAPGGINIDSNKDTTLVFDGTYWRVSKFSGY